MGGDTPTRLVEFVFSPNKWAKQETLMVVVAPIHCTYIDL